MRARTIATLGSSPHTRGAHRASGSPRRPRRIIPAYAGSTLRADRFCACRQDHPRIRGEHLVTCISDAKRAGSSPHTRGAPLERVLADGPGGIIPAYAGSTRVATPPYPSASGSSPHTRGARGAPARCLCRRRDHPRIRGEHGVIDHVGDLGWGSSPHTRGARTGWAVPGISAGIIPAYAGSTSLVSQSIHLDPDHPRIRGEHEKIAEAAERCGGSSPHTRGAPFLRPSSPLRGRIIPAYAGSTTPSNARKGQAGDHPRIRGEHHRQRVHVVKQFGIIPAYAGSTCRRSSTVCRGTDHPRIRGEHKPQRNCPVVHPGSSPHTRGALPVTEEEPCSDWDHPRIRGEHRNTFPAQNLSKGSSPHTRGAPTWAIRLTARPRIIPAYAGSTRYHSGLYSLCGDHPRIRGEHTWKSLQYQGSPP